MNIIEAFQNAENGKPIRNGLMKTLDRHLEYVAEGLFNEYELIHGEKAFQFERRHFSMGEILRIDWEVVNKTLIRK